MATSTDKPKATLVNRPAPKQPSLTEQTIAALRSKSYLTSVERNALNILVDNKETLLDNEETYTPPIQEVQVTMPKATAEKLYSLLGHIRRADGFHDLFDAFDSANFVMSRPGLHLDFVSPGVIRVETTSEYTKRTRGK